MCKTIPTNKGALRPIRYDKALKVICPRDSPRRHDHHLPERYNALKSVYAAPAPFCYANAENLLTTYSYRLNNTLRKRAPMSRG